MRISVRTITPRRLVLNFRPVSLWAYWTFGLLFMVLGGVVAVLLARAVKFTCSRAEGYCHYARSSVFGRQERLMLVSDLRGAKVETRVSGLVASMTLIAMVRDGDQAVPLVAADGATKDSLATALNRFVGDSSYVATFEVHESTGPIGYAFGLFLVGAGLVCLLAIERVHLVLDKDKGLLKLRRIRWLLISRSQVALARVKLVETRPFRVDRAGSWSVIIVLDTGVEMPLTVAPLFTASSAENTQQFIGRWLA